MGLTGTVSSRMAAKWPKNSLNFTNFNPRKKVNRKL